jgi:hypothetical protein
VHQICSLCSRHSSDPSGLLLDFAGYTLMPCARSTGIFFSRKLGPFKISLLGLSAPDATSLTLERLKKLGALTGCRRRNFVGRDRRTRLPLVLLGLGVLESLSARCRGLEGQPIAGSGLVATTGESRGCRRLSSRFDERGRKSTQSSIRREPLGQLLNSVALHDLSNIGATFDMPAGPLTQLSNVHSGVLLRRSVMGSREYCHRRTADDGAAVVDELTLSSLNKRRASL